MAFLQRCEMRDPYLYEDTDVLINLAGIKDSEILHQEEANITNLAMTNTYNQHYEKFNTETLKDIHRIIFGQIYDWAGESRTIQMIEPEDFDAFVWASQGIYSNYEYLERIFFDAVLGDDKLTILDNLVGTIPVQEERLARKWIE